MSDDPLDKVADAQRVLISVQDSGDVMTDEELQGRLSTAINHLKDAKRRVGDD